MGIDDINLNGILAAIAELIGCIITILFCQGKKRLTVFRTCFAIQILICFLIHMLKCEPHATCNLMHQYATAILICAIRIVNSFGYFVFMVYLVEIFETKNRMLGVALSQASNYFLFPVWLYIKNQLINHDLNPIHALLPFAVIASISTIFLRETLDQELG